ncbi:MAG: hypothetical protein WCT37_02975 [Patescibacteria group bacterium]|jgi:hypothetical protein
MLTERITLTMGVTPGYGHANEAAADETATLRAMAEAGITTAGQVEAETGIYPSFVLAPARVGYRHEWGCPVGGEFVVSFTGTRNPAFCADADKYRAAWMRFAEILKKEFGQTTATVEVVGGVEFMYLKTE